MSYLICFAKLHNRMVPHFLLCALLQRVIWPLPYSTQIDQCMQWYLKRDSGKILRGFHIGAVGGILSCFMRSCTINGTPQFLLFVLCAKE